VVEVRERIKSDSHRFTIERGQTHPSDLGALLQVVNLLVLEQPNKHKGLDELGESLEHRDERRVQRKRDDDIICPGRNQQRNGEFHE
jgi:hypothetical protein